MSRPDDQVRRTLGELLIAGLTDAHPDDVPVITEVAGRMLESGEPAPAGR